MKQTLLNETELSQFATSGRRSPNRLPDLRAISLELQSLALISQELTILWAEEVGAEPIARETDKILGLEGGK